MLNYHITLELAEAEPEADRLFGPSYDERQAELRQCGQPSRIDCTRYQPWKKPRIERKEARERSAPAA